MKHKFLVFGFLILSSLYLIGMDSPVVDQWSLDATFEYPTKILSAYFEKEKPYNLVLCQEGRVDYIDLSTKQSVNLNYLIVNAKTNLFVNPSVEPADIPVNNNFMSAHMIRKGQYLAWVTKNEDNQPGKARHSITLENSLAERKAIPISAEISIMPSFDSQGKPNCLMFKSDGNIAPIHFDFQEKLLLIHQDNKIGICKIDPNPDHSREYSFRLEEEHPIIFACFHPKKNIFASLISVHNSEKHKSKVSVFDAEKKQPLFSVLLKQMAYSLCFNHDNYLAAITTDSAEIMDINHQKIKKRVRISGLALSACFHPQGDTIAILSENKDRTGSKLHLINLENNSSHTFDHEKITTPLHCFNGTGDCLVTIKKNGLSVYKKS